MTTPFHDDTGFVRWLEALKPRDELIVRLALRDRIRDPATGRAWAARIKVLEDAMTVAEYEEVLANVTRVAGELERTLELDSVPTQMATPRAKTKKPRRR